MPVEAAAIAACGFFDPQTVVLLQLLCPLLCPLDNLQRLKAMARIKKRQPPKRGAKTRATVQPQAILGPPKGLIDTTLKVIGNTMRMRTFLKHRRTTIPNKHSAERSAQDSTRLRLPAEFRNRI